MAEPRCFLACLHWRRLPYGSGGYKAGTCTHTSRQTHAIDGCARHEERPIDWAAWGLAPPAPPPPPLTAAEAAAAAQPSLF